MERHRFPTRGIYRAEPGEIEAQVRVGEVGPYTCLRPARGTLPESEISDCWIVDPRGRKRPGCAEHPVPFHRTALGEPVN